MKKKKKLHPEGGGLPRRPMDPPMYILFTFFLKFGKPSVNSSGGHVLHNQK